ncbi:MAG: AMP-binding protein [Caulobacteraceae bacterium]|nr:AMP-binding protein [Caulobacteraceae bacterium]
MRVIDYFKRGLRHGPARAAFADETGVVSWAEADARVEALASALAAAGLKAGDRIGVFSPNDPAAFVAILAAFRLGAVWTPINARNSEAANRHWLGLSRCQALFYHSSLEAEALALAPVLAAPGLTVCLDREGSGGSPSLERFAAGDYPPAPEPPDGADIIASLFPTGGTTGLSKAALWSLQTWETLVGAFWQCLPSPEPPVHLVAGPMTHAAGVLALCAIAGGATNVILKKPSPDLILEAIERHRITHLYLPPTVVYGLLDHPGVRERDFSSLRYLVIAASPISPAKLREAMAVFGPVVCQCYGQAEAPMFLTFLSTCDLAAGPEARWSSCGRSTLATRLGVMGSDGAMLGAGQRGEIVARGNLTMVGYDGAPEATAAITSDGWRRTGDVGFQDEAGFVYIVDRAKDMIITGGFNVFSAEVEQVILEHPSVLDCAVIGVPDPKWGEAVKAVVELKLGAVLAPEDVIALVRERLGPVHAPKSVEIWRALPRSPAGKVVKAEIRERFWRGRERAVG